MFLIKTNIENSRVKVKHALVCLYMALFRSLLQAYHEFVEVDFVSGVDICRRRGQEASC